MAITQTLTVPGTAPSAANPTNFDPLMDARLAWENTNVSEMTTIISQINSTATAMNLNSTTDTSSSSVAIGIGAKTFTVTAGKSFQPGMFLVIADTAAPSTNSMYGQITSYSSTTLIMNILSVLGSGTKTAWTISQTSAANLNVDSASRVDSGVVTIASHATTGNIFAAAANTIEWTGTATTTAFPAAPKAGMTRDLYCTGACSFTSGANLIIEGLPSGTTITLTAGAMITVLALTTTQFKLFYVEYEEYTSAATACTGALTNSVTWKIVKIGKNVTLQLAPIVGTTTNVASFTYGLTIPAKYQPSDNGVATFYLPVVGGAIQSVPGYIDITSGVIRVFRDMNSTAWGTAANTGMYNAVSMSWIV